MRRIAPARRSGRACAFGTLGALFALAWNAFAVGADAPAAASSDCPMCSTWNEPVEPFRIYGNTWYVGPRGLSVVLITSQHGHVLIDSALTESAPMIEANIRKLGFRVEDIKYILNSHAHFDHAGSIAELQKDSRATVAATAAGAAAIERGHGDRGDPQFLSARAFPAAHDVRRVADGETIAIGDLSITAHATPGHTPGGASWTWKSCAGDRCLDIVFADSLSAISDDVYHYTDEAAHPGALAAFRSSIAMIGALPCDLLISTHPDASDFWARRDATSDGSGLIDRGACKRYAERAQSRLAQRISEERGHGGP